MRDSSYYHAKEILGRKPVKKGDVILTSEPFAYVISAHKQGQYCNYCLAHHSNTVLKPCRTCGIVWYCSEICNISDRDEHMYECKPLKRLHPHIPPSFDRLLARLIFKLKNGGEKIVENYAGIKSRKFRDLMNHYRDIKDDEERMKDVRNMMKTLKNFIGEANVPNESDFIGIYGRLLVNRFCLLDEMMSPVGSAVYLAASVFDHSCIPNAYPSFIGKKLFIRSLIDWEELDITKVRISYIDIVSSTQHRRNELRSTWYFWCDCPLCHDEERQLYENCLKCGNPFCGAPVKVPEKKASVFAKTKPEAPVCQECGTPVDPGYLEEYQNAVAFTRHRLKGMKEDSPSLETCRLILEKQGNSFSPMNAWRARTVDFMFNAAYQTGLWVTAMEYGKVNLEPMRYYYGASHPAVGLFLMKLGKAFLYLKMYRKGLTLVEEAELILKVALGSQHPIVKEEILKLKIMANEDIEILLESLSKQKEEEEHSLVCKHCGRRKQAQRHYELQTNGNEFNDEVNYIKKFDAKYFMPSNT